MCTCHTFPTRNRIVIYRTQIMQVTRLTMIFAYIQHIVHKARTAYSDLEATTFLCLVFELSMRTGITRKDTT